MERENLTVFAAEDVPFYDQITLSNWSEKGFISESEAINWHGKACGVVCVQMIAEAFQGEKISLGEIIREAVKNSAYNAGLGWVHQPLAMFISKRFNLFATAHRQVSIDRIKSVLIEGSLVMASVGLRFEGQKNGHLVVVLGCKIESGKVSGFYVHHPSTDLEFCWIKKYVPIEIFINSFSQNIIEVKRVGIEHKRSALSCD